MEKSQTVAKVMIVENDDPTRQLLEEHLEADRFDVVSAKTPKVARSLLPLGGFDLMLVDLAAGDGLELLREIRESDQHIAVIVVSGRATERERVRALGEGADDYVQKPFSYGELLARMNAVLRRTKKSDPVTRVGEIEINDVTNTVKVNGRKVRLSAKELALLKVLASEPSRVFSKEELLREVFGYRSIGHTRTLEAHARRLGSKLDPNHRRYVVNCWGVGWRLLWP